MSSHVRSVHAFVAAAEFESRIILVTDPRR